MASIRTSFEKELRYKLSQKATPHQGEENILLKSFKYFDLNNSGAVDREEFLKTVEKIGIQIFNKQDFYDLFDYYDLDKDGSLNYAEFTSILFGNQSGTTRKGDAPVAYSKAAGIEGVEEAVEKFRRKLKERGGTGILGLGRQFRIFDDDNSRSLNRNEFIKACKDFQVDVNDNEMQRVFDYFDRNRDGDINYDEFLLGMRGPMNNLRKNLVAQAFAKFDKDGSGVVTTEDLVGVYNAKLHPDVRAGKKTETQVFQEFMTTFEAYSDIQGINDGKITKDEFIDYYTFISASIDNDQYFELMINNAWRINDGANKNWEKKGWSDTVGAKGDGNLQKGYQDYAKNKPQQPQQKTPIKGGAQSQAQNGNKAGSSEFDSIMQRVRAKLATRGTRGFIGIQRQFKIMDDNNDKAISYQEFTKAMRDYKIELTEREVHIIFDEIDRDNSGSLSIDEIVRAIQGEMNSFRTALVDKVFSKLDKDGDGVIRVNDIKGVYNARNHPDVKSGKRTEDEILGEFLETFEMHHNLKNGLRDQNVTREEFQEYYNNVSANIDNDQYFELMIINGYKLYDSTPQYQQYAPAGGRKDVDVKAGWSQDYSGQFKSKTTANAPFGTSDQPTEYSTSLRPQTGQRREVEKKAGVAAGVSTQGVTNVGVKDSFNQGGNAGNVAKVGQKGVEDLVEDLRNKLQQRGVRGIFSLGRLFRNIDDDGSRSINISEFSKVCNEFRMDYAQKDLQSVFNYIDVNHNGEIDYDEFLRMIRGQMNDFRKKFVQQAFNKLDRDGSGVVNLDDIRGVYSAKTHPDVLAGKKSEEEILGEFLDTFEVHHANLTGDSKLRDKNVTFNEFVEYYNNISASIDDDRYFELMIRNAWNFDNVKYQKGWAADVKKH